MRDISKMSLKAQLHIPTNLYLKFQVKTISNYGETAQKQFWTKNNVFYPKNA